MLPASSFWDLLTYLRMSGSIFRPSEWSVFHLRFLKVVPNFGPGKNLSEQMRRHSVAFTRFHQLEHDINLVDEVTSLAYLIYPPKGQSHWSTVPSNRIHGNSSMGNVHWNLRLPPGLLEDLERLVERRERAMETQQAVLLMCGLKLR